MAASDHLHPDQLKLFMSGREFQAASNSSVDLGFSSAGKRAETSMPGLWKRKLAESKANAEQGGHGAGIYKSLEQHGYDSRSDGWDKPTLFARPGGGFKQGEGHHRVAAAADIERKSKGKRTIWMPVKYEQGFS